MAEGSVPKPGLGDKVHGLVRAGIALVPGLGGAAAEIFGLIVAAPLERRRQDWMESIVAGLAALGERLDANEDVSGQVDVDRLSRDPSFTTVLVNASQAAIRTHQQEKLAALRNAVLNTALPGSPDDNLKQVFLTFVDGLTPPHLKILKFYENPLAWAKEHGVTYPKRMMGGAATVLEDTFQEFEGQRAIYDVLVRDIHQRGLLGPDSLHVTVTEGGMYQALTTGLGSRFLAFITSPVDDLNPWP